MPIYWEAQKPPQNPTDLFPRPRQKGLFARLSGRWATKNTAETATVSEPAATFPAFLKALENVVPTLDRGEIATVPITIAPGEEGDGLLLQLSKAYGDSYIHSRDELKGLLLKSTFRPLGISVGHGENAKKLTPEFVYGEASKRAVRLAREGEKTPACYTLIDDTDTKTLIVPSLGHANVLYTFEQVGKGRLADPSSEIAMNVIVLPQVQTAQ